MVLPKTTHILLATTLISSMQKKVTTTYLVATLRISSTAIKAMTSLTVATEMISYLVAKEMTSLLAVLVKILSWEIRGMIPLTAKKMMT